MTPRRSGFSLAVALGVVSLSAAARAAIPACPASLGGYTATVTGSSVLVCPSLSAPAYTSTACPFTLGMDRVDLATGQTTQFTRCASDPSSTAEDAGTPCYLDPCVPPGTYEYGYQIPAFAFCTNNVCAGPTSGELAVVVAVTSAPTCAPADSGASEPAPWTLFDAGIEDGAVRWSGDCLPPLPLPDGGYCAWEWLDGSAQWAPCPPDGGSLCPGTEADGAVIPVSCDFGPEDAGPTSDGGAPEGGGGGPVTGSGNGATGTTGTPTVPPAGPGSSSGCGCSSGPTDGFLPFAPFFVLSLAAVLRRRRKDGV